jgi:hypothetical protein
MLLLLSWLGAWNVADAIGAAPGDGAVRNSFALSQSGAPLTLEGVLAQLSFRSCMARHTLHGSSHAPLVVVSSIVRHSL